MAWNQNENCEQNGHLTKKKRKRKKGKQITVKSFIATWLKVNWKTACLLKTNDSSISNKTTTTFHSQSSGEYSSVWQTAKVLIVSPVPKS